MITDRLKVIRNVSVLVCPKCVGEAHSAGTSSRNETSECQCGYAFLRGHRSWISSYGFRSDEYNKDAFYFRCDAILDIDSTEYMFVKREYDMHELYPELGVLDEVL